MKPSRLAVDTNVLLDLADEVDDVLDAFNVIDGRLPDADKLVPPSVLEELALLADSGETPKIRQSARRAVQVLRKDNRFRSIRRRASQVFRELADGNLNSRSHRHWQLPHPPQTCDRKQGGSGPPCTKTRSSK